MVINCAVCGQEKKIRPAKLKARNFCSHACYWKDKSQKTIQNCHVCGTGVLLRPSHVKKKNFCSIRCSSLHFSGENHQRYKPVESKFCKCGKELSHRLATNQISKHCSRHCGHSKESHYAWKGGVSPYDSIFEKQIRHQIKARDGEKCVMCGTRRYGKYNLHVHHIDHNKKNNDLNNLITLCARCHRHEHSLKAMEVKENLLRF